MPTAVARGALRVGPATPVRSDEWVSLAEAARLLQAAQQGSDLGCMARGLSETDEKLLVFWAFQVARLGVPVYGRRIMATRPEIIPKHEVLAGKLIDGAARLETAQGQPTQDACVLKVRRRDLDPCLTRKAVC